jgi:site-specific recombinase XerD
LTRSTHLAARTDIQLRIPPTDTEVDTLFRGWRGEMATTRRFATCARNYAAAKVLADVGLRINEARMLDLDDIHPELGRFGKLAVRFGKGSNGSGPRTRMTPLINGTDALVRWYVEDIRGLFEDAQFWSRPGAPLFPSERRNTDGSCCRISDSTLREALNDAVERHLPTWKGTLSPHVLRHYCASTLYLSGMDLLAIQELLGHRWVATTMRYVHVHSRHIDDAWEQAAQRTDKRLKGALR